MTFRRKLPTPPLKRDGALDDPYLRHFPNLTPSNNLLRKRSVPPAPAGELHRTSKRRQPLEVISMHEHATSAQRGGGHNDFWQFSRHPSASSGESRPWRRARRSRVDPEVSGGISAAQQSTHLPCRRLLEVQEAARCRRCAALPRCRGSTRCSPLAYGRRWGRYISGDLQPPLGTRPGAWKVRAHSNTTTVFRGPLDPNSKSRPRDPHLFNRRFAGRSTLAARRQQRGWSGCRRFCFSRPPAPVLRWPTVTLRVILRCVATSGPVYGPLASA